LSLEVFNFEQKTTQQFAIFFPVAELSDCNKGVPLALISSE